MKTVLITGIGRGIGKALADKFLAEGYFVIGTTYSSKAVPAAATTASLKTYSLDLSSSESIKKCADEIKKSGMKIDILVNNAGVMTDDEETSVISDKLRTAIEVNLIGTADFTERMIGSINKGGHIVFISSAAGSINDTDVTMRVSHHPFYYPAYRISKAALNMYARTLAARLAHEKYGIVVSCIHPGWVRTNMGGDEAPTLPEEAAAEIFALATSMPETGQFWYHGKKYQW